MLQERNTSGYKEALLIMHNSVCISAYAFKINFLKTQTLCPKSLKTRCIPLNYFSVWESLSLMLRKTFGTPWDANDVILVLNRAGWRCKKSQCLSFAPGQVMASVHVEGRQRGRVPSSSGSSSGLVSFQTPNFHIADGVLSLNCNIKLIQKETILTKIPRIMVNQILEHLWPC